MKTERLLQNGLINSGEPRHYNSWNLPEVPKLRIPGESLPGGTLFRRQKAHAPKIGREKVGWIHIIHSLRRDAD